MQPKFILIGGFLGAGKSTTVARLASHYQGLGMKVGIITNDQTTDLVDTHSLRNQGFEVGEVAGACFCCSFNELTATVEKLSQSQLPDVIIAEPVGSCTDLVATVIRPLVDVYQTPLDIAPYGVILKPSHGLRILANEGQGGFSPKAAYIFNKQVEESDFVVINRIDELSAEHLQKLEALVETTFPGRTIIKMSARTGEGFSDYVAQLEAKNNAGSRALEVDYDIYAEGEAELGWLNSQLTLAAANQFDLDTLLLDIVSRLQTQMIASSTEVAHLKTIGMWDGNYAVANAVSNFTSPELSLASGISTTTVDLVINARVAASPEELEAMVREQVAMVASQIGGTAEFKTLQSFRPGRPEPTHRITL